MGAAEEKHCLLFVLQTLTPASNNELWQGIQARPEN
jgi:hypothetical protein